MSSKNNSEEEAVKDPPYHKETQTLPLPTEEKITQTEKILGPEKWTQTTEKDFDKAKAFFKAKKRSPKKKLKPVPSGDDPQSTMQTDLTMQVAQAPPPPPSEKDDYDSLIQQLSTLSTSGQSDPPSSQPPLYSSQPDPPSSQPPLDSSQPDPPSSQPPLDFSQPDPPSSQPPLDSSQPDPPSPPPLDSSQPDPPSQPPLDSSQPDPPSQPPLDSSQPDPPSSQPPDSSQLHPVSSQLPPDSSQSDPPPSLPPPGSSRPDSKSADEKTRQKKLCEQILNAGPFQIIGDSQISFSQFYSEFCYKLKESNQLEKIEKEFMAINNDFGRIKMVLELDEIKNLNVTVSNSKSEEYAKALEEEYNSSSNSKDTEKLKTGLQLINKSIQFTPDTPKKTLAVRIMKRAWTNVTLSKFKEAKEDAQRSLHLHSDISDMWNSNEVLGHCYAHSGDNYEATGFFESALNGLRQSKCDRETKAVATSRITSVYKFTRGRNNIERSDDPDPIENLETPSVIHGINRTLKCATEAVHVKIDEKTGRGLYAKREIEPGDVIMVEKPYVSALNIPSFETHCYNCFKRLKNPVECDSCSWVWFCSEMCLREAKDGFHGSECPVLNLLFEKTIGNMGIIAFRILLRLTWENIKSLRKSRKVDTRLNDSHPLHLEFDWKENYFTDDYLTTYKLVTNAQKRSFGDLLKRSIIAVYIKHCLKVVDFFKGDNVSLDDEIYVASLILRHLQNSSCNGYSITEFIVGESCLDNVDILELGGGIYPTISLINHSCDPNVFRYCIGKNCIVRATKLIGKGEQLLDSYGSLFDVLGRESRQIVLTQQYKFNCDCTACKENWPLFRDNKVYMKLACPEENCHQIIKYNGEEKLYCASCGFNKNHEKLMKEVKSKITEFKQGLNSLKGGLIEKAAVTLGNFQMYADRNVIPPSKCLTECQETYKRCFLLQGNLFKKETES